MRKEESSLLDRAPPMSGKAARLPSLKVGSLPCFLKVPPVPGLKTHRGFSCRTARCSA